MKRTVEKEEQQPDLSAILAELPPFVSRTWPRFREVLGYSSRSLANMDSLGKTAGVKRILLGNTVAYERESLVAWLEGRSKVIS